MIYRLAEDMINLNGVTIYKDCNDNWFLFEGKRLNLVQLQELQYFLNKETVAKIKAFNEYVDRVIDNLIYSRRNEQH